MKKILYSFLCIVFSCVSLDFSKYRARDKDNKDNVIEEQSKTSLILKPFKIMGLLWSCSPEDEPDGSGSHRSHQSHSSHSSHYSSR